MFLAPQAEITEREVERGVRRLVVDAAFASAVGALNSGVILVAFALWLGAPNTIIGVLAAIPFWTQLLQAPAVSWVERLRTRRRLSILALIGARAMLPLMALLPFVPDKRQALILLLVFETIHTALNAVCACSWNSWIRDLVPEQRLGLFFARRTIYATAIGMICSLGAGVALQSQGAAKGGGDGTVFTVLYVLGFGSAIISTLALSRVPEPLMPEAAPKQSLFRLLKTPLRDANFRNLIRFMASWQFAVNSATPFFTVYFVQSLGFGMGWVTAFTVVSQLANILVLRTWGGISDRFSNKSVLNVAAPAFIACIGGMVLASQINERALLAAYLVVLHVFMGMAAAGVSLATGNIAMKLAPRGSATAYIAANSLIASFAAGLAPIIGGFSADFYAARELSFHMLWRDPSGVSQFLRLEISHWDFYFLISGALGLYACHRLAQIREEGTIGKREVVGQLVSEARRTIRGVAPVDGSRLSFPGASLIEQHARLHVQKRAARARARRETMQGV